MWITSVVAKVGDTMLGPSMGGPALKLFFLLQTCIWSMVNFFKVGLFSCVKCFKVLVDNAIIV